MIPETLWPSHPEFRRFHRPGIALEFPFRRGQPFRNVLKKGLQTLVGVAVTAAFLALVEYTVGWVRLLTPWLHLSWSAIGFAVALAVLSYWLRAMRLYDYFRDEMRGAFGACMRLMLLHNVFNNLLPARTGELSFPVLMARYFDVPAARSVPVLLWFRLLDLHALGLFALAAAALLLPVKIPLLAALLAWALLPWFAWRLDPWIRAQLPRRLHGRLARLADQALAALPGNARAYWRAWAWTLVNWAVKLGVFAWILQLFVTTPAAAAWLGAIAGDLSSVLPVHGIAGAGTFEAGVVAGLLASDIDASAALAGAVNLHLFILGSTLAGGLLAFAFQGRARG